MSLNGKEILLVDDDPDLRIIVKKILENVGLTVTEAETVTTAYELYCKRAPHLIICDLAMKPHSGFDLFRLLRAKSEKIPIPVLVLSADQTKETIYKAMSMGVSDYLIKPINAALLLQKIRKNLKNEAFQTYNFPTLKQKNIPIQIPVKIVAASEIGFRVEAAVRLQPLAFVKLKSSLLDELALNEHSLRVSPNLAKSFDKGIYNNEIRLAGITEVVAGRIRRFIRAWK